jgi:hypothetical protein
MLVPRDVEAERDVDVVTLLLAVAGDLCLVCGEMGGVRAFNVASCSSSTTAIARYTRDQCRMRGHTRGPGTDRCVPSDAANNTVDVV